jgi:hypothetical protein
MHWARRVEEPDIAAEARFAFFVGSYDTRDEALLCWVRHLTPEALRSPRLVQHANGARALRSVVIATRGDPVPLVARQLACGGTAAPGGVAFGDGLVEISRPDALPPLLADAAWPADPYFAALRIAFDDPAVIAARVVREGYAAPPWQGGFALDLRAPLGCVLIAER